MVFITIEELIAMVITIVFVGYIFSDIFPKRMNYQSMLKMGPRFDVESFKFAAIVAGSAIILHELGHKIVAMSFGMQATYQAAFAWLILGVILKLMNVGFIVLVPAFVSITGNGTPLQFSLVALAGPMVNLILWLVFGLLIKNRNLFKKHSLLLHYGKEINKFLFIFNILPIPGFDGYKVLGHLLQLAGVNLPLL
jgi:Zn-dependent protease